MKAFRREWTHEKSRCIDWYNLDDVTAHKFTFFDFLSMHAPLQNSLQDNEFRDAFEAFKANPTKLIKEWQRNGLLVARTQRWCRECGREGHTLVSCPLKTSYGQKALGDIPLRLTVEELVQEHKDRCATRQAKEKELAANLILKKGPAALAADAASATKKKRRALPTYSGVIRDVVYEKKSGSILCNDTIAVPVEVFLSLYRCSGYGMKVVRKGDKVGFALETSAKGLRAVDVTPENRTLQDDDVNFFLEECDCNAYADAKRNIANILLHPLHWDELLRAIQGRPPPIKLKNTMSLIGLLRYVHTEQHKEKSFGQSVLEHLIRQRVQQSLFFPSLLESAIDDGNMRIGDLCSFVHVLRMLRLYGDMKSHSFADFQRIFAKTMSVVETHQLNVELGHEVQELRQTIAKKEDIRPLLLLPTAEELKILPTKEASPLFWKRLPVLKTQGKPTRYTKTNDHMEAHYQLLRADCFSQFVTDIRVALDFENVNEKPNASPLLHLYENIQYCGEYIHFEAGGCPIIRFEPLPNKKHAPDTIFVNGSLVFILTMPWSSGSMFPPEGEYFFARVCGVSNRGLLALRHVSGNASGDLDKMVQNLKRNQSNNSKESYMLKAPCFYPGYEPVLGALRSFLDDANSVLPFDDVLIQGKFEQRPVGFVPAAYRFAYQMEVDSLRRSLVLDSGQEEALKVLPCTPVMLIQGPPGTGKSFIGCRIVEAITTFRLKLHTGRLGNLEESYSADALCSSTDKVSPVFVVTFKNHALDEFLADLLDTGMWCGGARNREGCRCTGNMSGCCKKCCTHEKNIVRLGTRIENPRLLPYSLKEKVLAHPKSNSFYEYKAQLSQQRSKLSSMLESVDKLEAGEITEELFMRHLTADQKVNFQWSQLRDWLAGRVDATDSSFLTPSPALSSYIMQLSTILTRTQRVAGLDDDDDDDEEGLGIAKPIPVDTQPDSSAADSSAAGTQTRGAFNQMQNEADSATSLSALREGFIVSKEALETLEKVVPLPTCDKRTIWSLSLQERHDFLMRVIRYHVAATLSDYRSTCLLHNHLSALAMESRKAILLDVLQKADVVAATTTGCAMHIDIVRALSPSVMVVEEAAEILESQLLSCITPTLQQLVLIGDHQQLQPSVESYDLERFNHMNQSLFERLATTIPVIMLCEQRRMKKEICDLVRPFYTRSGMRLVDHASVASKVLRDVTGASLLRVPGLASHPVLWWSHNVPETQSDVGVSLMNKTEAHMASYLAAFFLFQGVQPSSITIITPYLGQRREIKTCLRTHTEIKGLNEVQVSTVDRYQGDENDVIILSTVRTQKLTDFLKLENRMIVACSRARHALVILASEDLLQKSPHWAIVINTLGKEHITPTPSLRCSRHAVTQLTLTCQVCEAVMRAPGGGTPPVFCAEPCGFVLCKKGHTCERICHSDPHPSTQVGSNCPKCRLENKK